MAKTKYPTVYKLDGTPVVLNKVNTLRLCRDLWAQLKDNGSILEKAMAIRNLGFQEFHLHDSAASECTRIDHDCFCCAQLDHYHHDPYDHTCNHCLLRELWQPDDTDNAPCEYGQSPYRAWKNGVPGSAQKIVDYCNQQLRKMHVKLR